MILCLRYLENIENVFAPIFKVSTIDFPNLPGAGREEDLAACLPLLAIDKTKHFFFLVDTLHFNR